MRTLLVSLCFSVGFIAPGTPVHAKKTRMAVLDLTLERGLDAAIVRLLNELLLGELSRAPTVEVIGGSDLKALLDVEQQKLHFGCTDDSCLAEIGAALGAEYLVVGTLGAVGSRYILSLKLLNAREARVVARQTLTTPQDEDALIGAVTKGARGLMATWRGDDPSMAAPAPIARADAAPSEIQAVEPTATPGTSGGAPAWPAITATVGAVAAGGAAAFFGVTALQKAEARDRAPTLADYRALNDAARSHATGATAATVAGGVLAASAVGLWLWYALAEGVPDESATTRWGVHPSGILVSF